MIALPRSSFCSELVPLSEATIALHVDSRGTPLAKVEHVIILEGCLTCKEGQGAWYTDYLLCRTLIPSCVPLCCPCHTVQALRQPLPSTQCRAWHTVIALPPFAFSVCYVLVPLFEATIALHADSTKNMGLLLQSNLRAGRQM